MSLLEIQKLQRLRINRVAIIQELHVEHILQYLLTHGVISQADVEFIVKEKQPKDRTKVLLDLLPKKGRNIDWFYHFKCALQNPDTRSNDVRNRYQILFDFLDNSIIDMPPKTKPSATDGAMEKKSYPRYKPLPGIDNTTFNLNSDNKDCCVDFESDTQLDQQEKQDDSNTEIKRDADLEQESTDLNEPPLTLIKGYFHKWIPAPKNFTSLITEPKEHFKWLEESQNAEHTTILKLEKAALQNMYNLEILFLLEKRQQLPKGFELIMSSTVEAILSEPDTFHMYFKYFQQLKEKNHMDFLDEIACSFENFLADLPDASDNETRPQVIKIGFGLFEILHQFGLFYRAELVIYALINYLCSYVAIETWMATWEALIKLMVIRNDNVNFVQADYVYNAAVGVADKIKLMSFGQDLLDESEMFRELSRMLREQGSIGTAYDWARKAMKEVEPTNYDGIVTVLINASLAYSMKWNLKKAEDLAVEAVKQARQHFGTYHPLYVKALLNYCRFASEFRQDSRAVEIARNAVEVTLKTYGGCHTVLMAEAYQTLAEALIFNQQFTNDEYYDCAMKAWRIALDVIPGDHPKLALFRYTLAHCLKWQAYHATNEKTAGLLIWAEMEATGALRMFQTSWGEYSLRAAQAYILLGEIYTKMDKLQNAEEMLMSASILHRLGVPARSNYTYLLKSKLAKFYRQADKPQEAIELLKSVVTETDCDGVYLKWVHFAYDALIDLLCGAEEGDEAQKFQTDLMDWMTKKTKPTQPITWEQLHAKPVAYDDFYKDFNKLAAKFQMAKKGLKNLKKNVRTLGIKM